MLILIGVVPTAYALNRAMPDSDVAPVPADRRRTSAQMLDRTAAARTVADPRARRRQVPPHAPITIRPSCRLWRGCPSTSRAQVEQLRLVSPPSRRNRAERSQRHVPRRRIDPAARARTPTVKFGEGRCGPVRRRTAPSSTPQRGSSRLWVKVSVAIALGLGTMVGWKRIVVTVGEKIGKSHLTYAQGASAEHGCRGDDRRGGCASACQSLPRTSSLPASPGRWRQIAQGCRWPPCATC